MTDPRPAPLVAPDEADHRQWRISSLAHAPDSRLALHVPIVFADRVLGHIAIDDPGERREFTEREIALVEGIASQAAVAIENARLYEAENAVGLGRPRRGARQGSPRGQN